MAIKVKGLKALQKDMGKSVALLTILPPLAKGMRSIKTAARQYPPPPAGSRYVRTFKLRQSWEDGTSARGSKAVGIVATDISYGPYVRGDKQAAIHRGRWRLLEDIAESKLSEIEQDIEEEVAKTMEGKR
jgi:hypothetical protein